MTPKHFLVARTDGLGERLKAMLNALVLADYFGIEFKFQWRVNPTLDGGGHCIFSAEETFSPDFLHAHHLPRFNPDKYVTLPAAAMSLADMRGLIYSCPAGIIVNQQAIERLVTGIDDLPGRFRAAWERIRWVAHTQTAIDMARVVSLPNNIAALHLRAGDMIYGNFRLFDSYTHKALCFPVAKRIVIDLIDNGQWPVIFGQDAPTCQLLTKSVGGSIATDLVPFTDDLAAALAEIVLMSRCQEIYAGVSGFSKVAELIGGGRIINPMDVYTAEEIIQAIENDSDVNSDSPLSDLQKAFALFNVVYYGYKFLNSQSLVNALEAALSYDPDNAFYYLLKAKYETPADAEHTLGTMIAECWQPGQPFAETTIRRVIKNAYGGYGRTNKLPVQPYLEKLRSSRTPARPSSSLIGQFAEHARDRSGDFEEYPLAPSVRAANK